jgi:hypothetical protein
MKTLAFFLEEPSAKEMLMGLLPRILPDSIQVRYLVFRGKQDLEKNLKRRLRGWMTPDSLFVVLRDQDSGDCRAVKSKLTDICREAGRDGVLIRVACRELESFYLGDLAAVEEGLGISGLRSRQQNRKFRNPDRLGSPSRELIRLTRNAYDKISGSRAIGPKLTLEGNRSRSFQVLLSGLRKLINE